MTPLPPGCSERNLLAAILHQSFISALEPPMCDRVADFIKAKERAASRIEKLSATIARLENEPLKRFELRCRKSSLAGAHAVVALRRQDTYCLHPDVYRAIFWLTHDNPNNFGPTTCESICDALGIKRERVLLLGLDIETKQKSLLKRQMGREDPVGYYAIVGSRVTFHAGAKPRAGRSLYAKEQDREEEEVFA
jgi:hypothetical protein